MVIDRQGPTVLPPDRARSGGGKRLRRPPSQSFGLLSLTWAAWTTASRCSEDHSAYLPDHAELSSCKPWTYPRIKRRARPGLSLLESVPVLGSSCDGRVSLICGRPRWCGPRCCSRCCPASAACLCASGRAWLVHADLGDGRPDPALAERAGDGDAMVPVERVVPVAAVVEIDWVHAATTSEVGGYPLKARSRQLRGGPEMAVKAERRLDRSDDVINWHGCLAGQSMAACAGDDRHLI